MKKIIAAAIIALMLLFCGCVKQDADLEMPSDRFVFELRQDYGLGGCCIIRDNETGCAYLFVKDGYGGGLTKLEEVNNGD